MNFFLFFVLSIRNNNLSRTVSSSNASQDTHDDSENEQKIQISFPYKN